jgi:hypothetical protein
MQNLINKRFSCKYTGELMVVVNVVKSALDLDLAVCVNMHPSDSNEEFYLSESELKKGFIQR